MSDTVDIPISFLAGDSYVAKITSFPDMIYEVAVEGGVETGERDPKLDPTFCWAFRAWSAEGAAKEFISRIEVIREENGYGQR